MFCLIIIKYNKTHKKEIVFIVQNIKEANIIQNLKDAGCNKETVDAFIKAIKANKVIDGLKILCSHRMLLLDKLHKAKKQIDCLDYLIYQVKKRT